MQHLFDTIRACFGNKHELCSMNFKIEFNNASEALLNGQTFYNAILNETINERNKIEQYYYERIKNGLMSKLIEIKSYSNVNIFDTRRLICTNDDCISSLQILIREKIFINIYMRSSDFDGALASDLEFFSSLPFWLINQLINMQNDYRFTDITDENINKIQNMKIEFNVMFGSLHRTK